jgi:hypothetical protein
LSATRMSVVSASTATSWSVGVNRAQQVRRDEDLEAGHEPAAEPRLDLANRWKRRMSDKSSHARRQAEDERNAHGVYAKRLRQQDEICKGAVRSRITCGPLDGLGVSPFASLPRSVGPSRGECSRGQHGGPDGGASRVLR